MGRSLKGLMEVLAASWMEWERFFRRYQIPIEVVNFGKVVDVVALESHSEVRGFKNVGKDVWIVDRIIRDNISGNRSQEDSETRLDRHNEAGVIE